MILPAAAPTILTGMRISIGIAWLVIVAAEMLVGGTGIGYFVWNEWNNLSLANVIFAILVIGLVGMLLDLLFGALQQRGHLRRMRTATRVPPGPGPRQALRRARPSRCSSNVNFAIERGEFVCIIGHSGCGKTTILNVLAGLDRPSAGDVVMDGREVAGPSLDRGVVFQGHALMPWLTVRNNIAFAVRCRWPDWTRSRGRRRIARIHRPGRPRPAPSTRSPRSSPAA